MYFRVPKKEGNFLTCLVIVMFFSMTEDLSVNSVNAVEGVTVYFGLMLFRESTDI